MDTLDLLTGRPTRLTVLDYGLFRVHSGPREIGICGYLVQTDTGEAVLIDGGFPAKYTVDARAASAEDSLGDFGVALHCEPENTPEAQLALMGVAPEALTLTILSHSHIDHLGALTLAPHAPMLISAAERALPRPLYWTGGQPLDWPDRRMIEVAVDTLIGPGFTVLEAPGHAPGQLAFLVELPSGPILLTSDAISRPAEIREGFDTAPDPETAQASAERLMQIAETWDARIIYGHDPAQWPELRKAPEGYT